MLSINKVVGQSMSPAIPENSFLIFHRFIYHRCLTVGKIIKVKHPIYGLIVKKLIRIDQQGLYWLEGLNASSVSSIQMGAIKRNMITGIVVYHIKKST
ncbi:MAG: nickel-type superoxide dismutase maturation protease [Psychromonas sp.]|nr:nickel-type superoxide dismutase maturation protease [Alteromonadales bacterium]MCP5077617.1 nickel-type superoxide dismutase maturation protease [Psychromonas sp.]